MNKKFTALIAAALLVAMCMCLAACGNRGETKPGVSTDGTTQPTIREDGVGSGRPNADGVTQPATGDDTTDPTTDATTEATTDGTTDPTVPSTEATTPATKPTESTSKPNNDLSMNYQQYMALSGQEQQLFYDKHFANDPLGFAAWFQKIKQAYDDETPEVIATGPIDIGDYINP